MSPSLERASLRCSSISPGRWNSPSSARYRDGVFYNPIVLTPLAKQTSSVKWFGLATATWDRILKLLSLVPAHPLPKALWEAGGKQWQGSAEALEDPPGDPAQEEARKVAHLQWSQARAQEIEQSSASYKSWLQESFARGHEAHLQSH